MSAAALMLRESSTHASFISKGEGREIYKYIQKKKEIPPKKIKVIGKFKIPDGLKNLVPLSECV